MFESRVLFYSFFIGILWPRFCNGATHWIVTEDGRIQQQADSIFNLKRPYDLVTFIQQQTTFDRMKILREEYLEEKRKVIEAREKERQETTRYFYKADPDCIEAGAHISEFDLQLDTTISFADKGINIVDHVDMCQVLSAKPGPPLCQAELPFTMRSYDHLEGVSTRHEYNYTVTETGLMAKMPYFKDVDDLGGRLQIALEKKPSSWVLLNLAAYYWRIKGNGLYAVECLRRALYFSPREHRDRALMSLAAVLHHANHTLNSAILMHASLEVTQDLSVSHFILGNIYSSLKMYEMAELCYRFTLALTHDTNKLCERLKAVRCELKLKRLLQDRQLAFDEKLDSLKTPELNDSGEPAREELDKKHSLPLETFKRQLNRLYVRLVGESETTKCHNNVIHLQGQPSSTEHVKGSGKTVGGQEKKVNHRTEHKQQQTRHQKENKSRDTEIEKASKGMPRTKTTEATLVSNTRVESDDVRRKEMSDFKEGVEESAVVKATGTSLDHSNVSKEEKTLKGLEEAKVALDRVKKVIRTVSRVSSANEDEENGVRDDSDTINEQPTKSSKQPRASSKGVQESAEVDKGSKVRRRGGRRGESGSKKGKSEADSTLNVEKDPGRSFISEGVKIPRQKGDLTTLIDKNAPGWRSDGVTSKNARDIPNAASFEERKGASPVGPKHTPPLKSKEAQLLQKNCESPGRRKRKGDAFSKECWNLEPVPEQPDSATSTGNQASVPDKSSQSPTEFTKGSSNGQASGSQIPEVVPGGETVSMRQTPEHEISATVASSSKTNGLTSTSETTVSEETEKEIVAVKDSAETKAVDEKVNSSTKDSKAKTSNNANSKARLGRGLEALTTSREKRELVEPETSPSQENGEQPAVEPEISTSREKGEQPAVESETSTSLKKGEQPREKKKVPPQSTREEEELPAVEPENSGKKGEEPVVEPEISTSGENKQTPQSTEQAAVETETSASRENEKTPQSTGKNGEQPAVEPESTGKNGEEPVGEPEISTSGENKQTPQSIGEKGQEPAVKSETMSSQDKGEQAAVKPDTSTLLENTNKTPPQGTGDKKPEERTHTVGAGSSVFETSVMNVNTDGSVPDLNEQECGHIRGVEALVVRNKQFSAWLSLETKDVDVQAHIDFSNEVDDLPRRPRCTAKIKNNQHTFDHLQGVVNAAKLEQVVEAGLTQTFLAVGRIMQSSVDELGTRIYNALKKNTTSWVLLNVASLYWRVLGDTTEAIKCLRQALYFSPANTRDVAQISLASILLREGRLDDTTVVIKKALEISPSLALGHFILGNVFGAQSKIPEAIQHYLFALQLEPGFAPAIERLKIIQCVLWRQQKDLEKEAEELRKLLTPT